MKKVAFIIKVVALFGCQKEQIEKKVEVERASIPCACSLPYYVYTAVLNQGAGSGVTVTELQNTLGSISWEQTDLCRYVGTSDGLFTEGRTFIVWQNGINVQLAPFDVNSNVNEIVIHNDWCEYEYGLTNRQIEIRVYP